MSSSFAKRLSAVSPSVTLVMNAKAAALREQGKDVIAFGVGEPDFEPPKHVLEAAKAAIDKGASKYTATTGIPALKKAIAEITTAKRHHPVTPDQVCVSVGAKHALFNIALALYEPGDEVIVPAPYWVSYPEQVRMFGATPVIVETRVEDGFRMSGAQLEKVLTAKTKAVILCSPSNPTGSVYSREQLADLLNVLAKHDAWLVVDEIYADLLYEGDYVSAPALRPDLKDRIIIIDGVSKSYAMTGWRIGWSITTPKLAKVIDVVQGQSTTNPTSVAQSAALAALTGPQDEISVMRSAFKARRDIMVEGLASIPGITCQKPDGAFYVLADCTGLYGLTFRGSSIMTDDDVAFFFLEDANVATVPGSGFGAPGYVRFSYATGEARIKLGIERLAEAVKRAQV
jgi:aspartate aminotransferase